MSKIVIKILATSVVTFFSTAPTSPILLIFSELFIHFLLCFGYHSSNADIRCQQCNHLCVVSCCICSLCCFSIWSLLHLYLFHQSQSTSCVILRVIWMHGHVHCNWLHSSATVHSKEHSAQDTGSHSYSSNFFCGGFRVLSPKKNRKNNTVWIHVGLGTRPNIQVFLKFFLYPRQNNFFKKIFHYNFIHDCVRLLISTNLSNWHFQWMDDRLVIWLLFFPIIWFIT